MRVEEKRASLQNKDIYFLLIFMGFVVSVAVDIVDASYNARLHES